MATRILLLAVTLCLLGPPAARAEDAPAPPTPEATDAAIERGVAWLIGEQKGRGTWGPRSKAVGPTALAAYALLHAGVAEEDGTRAGKRLGQALQFLERKGPGRGRRADPKVGTYELALMLLLLRSRGRPEDRERMQCLADRLCARQSENGQWWYLPEGRGRPRTGDNSNAQFAVLALGAAVGEGLSVDPDRLASARRWWLSAAQPSGGFGYSSGGSTKSAATGSMTAAGVACLAILDAALGTEGLPPEAAAVRRRAVAFLADVFSVRRNHGPAQGRAGQRQRNAGRGWVHYYLWTVERAMVLHGDRRLGTHDWYPEGVAHLLGSQAKDGSWRQEQPVYATCFALLFLSRAADPPRAFTPHSARPGPPAPKGPVTGPPKPAAPDPARPLPGAQPSPAEATGTVADWLREDLPPGVLAERCRGLGASSLRGLLRALRARDAQVRQRAFEALRELLPTERTERVDRHPLPRGRLDLWLRLHARDLVLTDGRFALP